MCFDQKKQRGTAHAEDEVIFSWEPGGVKGSLFEPCSGSECHYGVLHLPAWMWTFTLCAAFISVSADFYSMCCIYQRECGLLLYVLYLSASMRTFTLCAAFISADADFYSMCCIYQRQCGLLLCVLHLSAWKWTFTLCAAFISVNVHFYSMCCIYQLECRLLHYVLHWSAWLSGLLDIKC